MACSIAIFNVCGISTTKYATAAQRSTIDTSRTLIIWIMSVALGLEKFHYQAIFGFVSLTFGTLLYNEIIVIRIWGYDQNTKEAKAAREAGNGAEKTDAAYMGLSPGKGHQTDARNKRNLNTGKDAHYMDLNEQGEYEMSRN